MPKDDASAPLREYANVVSASASVAETALPMSVPDGVFSVIERDVLVPAVNTGAF